MLWAVDRIEGDRAVLVAEDGTAFSVPQGVLPGAKEGDIYRIEPDEAERERRLADGKALLSALLARQ
ncbi:MAG: DUF3006 domain-containing protein [Clostridia bacterium]|nr:DUF3006 domain-containing protein [Clostridia bacterium]